MKQKIIYFIVPAVLVLGMAGQSGFAQGLLGKRYMGFEIGQTIPGDDFDKDVDDSFFVLGGGVNIPVHPNVDAIVSLSYTKAEGDFMGIDLEATRKRFLCGINYHFTPNQKVNPFVGIAAGLVRTEAKASYAGYKISDDEDDPAIAISGGVEVALNDQVAVRPAIEYGKVGSEDDFIAGIGLSLWFNESVFGGLSVSYAFDEGDVSYSVGMGFGF